MNPSQEGYDNLVAELKQLVTVERPKAFITVYTVADMRYQPKTIGAPAK